MYRGTTPTLLFTIEGIDLTGCTVYISISDSAHKRTWTWNNADNPGIQISTTEEGCSILLPLTQEETLVIPPARALVQVRWINEDGVARATDVAAFNVDDVLYQEVISFRGDDSGE